MINIKEIKIGGVIKCGTTKAIVTFIDGDEICILHEWGETDRLEEEHFKFWDDTGIIIEEFKKILEEIKDVQSEENKMAKIKVGAIIKYQGEQGTLRGVVTRFDSLNGYCNVLWEDGYTSFMDAERVMNMLVADETYDIENTLNAIKSEDIRPEIEVGAIVRGDFCDGIVTKADGMYDGVFILWSDGGTSSKSFTWVKNHLTGRKIEIEWLNGMLDEIKEVND